MKIICVQSCDGDMSFEVLVKNDNQMDVAIRAVKEGWNAWLAATTPEEWNGEYFTKEEVESFYELGFTEPTQIILDRLQISYEFVSCYDDEGNWNGRYSETEAVFIW